MSLSFICGSFTVFWNCRNGEEWYRIRRILNMKMLRPKVTEGYAEPLNDVASDLVAQIKAIRGTDGVIPSLEDELFKWSLECKSVTSLLVQLSNKGL